METVDVSSGTCRKGLFDLPDGDRCSLCWTPDVWDSLGMWFVLIILAVAKRALLLS